jgi:DNA-binding beta-propeller fold protein YncE
MLSAALAAVALVLSTATVAWGLGGLSQNPGTAGCISSSLRGCQKGQALKGAERVALSSDGKNVYVTSYTQSAISIFDRDPATGALTQKPGLAGCIAEHPAKVGCGQARALDEPEDVTLSPDGRSVYVASVASDAVAIFNRDPATGALNQKLGSAGCISETGTDETGGACQKSASIHSPNSVVVSPDGRNVYLTSLAYRQGGRESKVRPSSGSVSIFKRSPATGALRQKSGTAGCISGTGRGGACKYVKAIGEPLKVVVSSDGKSVYVTSLRPNSLAIFDRNRATGALTQKAGSAGCIADGPVKGGCEHARALKEPKDLAVSQDGKNVYVASFDSNAVAIFDRNPGTGALNQKPGKAGCISGRGTGGACRKSGSVQSPDSLTVSPDSRNVYVTSFGGSAVSIFDRNPATGVLIQEPGTAGCVSDPVKAGCSRARALSEPQDVVVSPDGKSVYVASLAPGAVSILQRFRPKKP